MQINKTTIKDIISSRRTSFIIIWLIVSAVGCYFRLYPLRTYTPDEISEKASLFVVNKLRTEIRKTITEIYPQLSPLQRRKLVKKEFDKLLKELNVSSKPKVRMVPLHNNLADFFRWPIVVALIVLLCVEWSFRKRKGLV